MKETTLLKLKETNQDCHDFYLAGQCHDCGKNVQVTYHLTDDRTKIEAIEGGMSYEPELQKESGQRFFLKCVDCWEKDSTLRNYREIEVYSRVVGYMRPTKNWNEGKRAEFNNRKMFKMPNEVKNEM